MVMRLQVKVFGITTAIKQLNLFAATLQDWSPYWEKVEEFLDARAEQAFDTEGRSHGMPWSPLSPKYAIQKARDGYGNEKILVRTGDMKSGLLGKGTLAHTVRTRGKRRFTWGSTDPLVAIHNAGIRFGRGFNLPARPILVLTKRDVDALAEEAGNYIQMLAISSGMAALTSFTRRGRVTTQLRGPSGRFFA